MGVKEELKNRPSGNWKRFYTAKSYKMMNQSRAVILVATAPLWLPLYTLLRLMDFGVVLLENLLDGADDLLQKFLDKVIPQKW